jgi:outer membrane protein assembly factor BamB
VRVLVTLLGVLAAASTALAGSVPEPIVLSRPSFRPPATDDVPSGRQLVLVSSRYRDPAILPPDRPAPPSWAPQKYRDAKLDFAVRQRGRVFLVYEGRYVLGANPRNQAILYAFDFQTFMRPPNGGEVEPVTWAREVDGTLYVANSHLTYASTTNGRNAYVSAIDLDRGKTRWRCAALVANARTFVVTGDLIVAGYGFTAEPDFLYLLDRRSGRVLDRLLVPSAPEVIRLRAGTLHVRTYDRQLLVKIEG